MISCRSEDGRDLTLSDIELERENISCQVIGSDVLSPVLGDSDTILATTMMKSAESDLVAGPNGVIEESILDHIREMILNAQRNGCWKVGVGGVSQVSVIC